MVEFIIPTNYSSADKRSSRPIIPIQMQKPDGTWSDPIKFNFDTGASNPTDVPPQILTAFGGAVATSARKAQPGKIKIPGFNNDQVMDIPIMVQDKAHYDLFRTQSTRYPLVRVYDLMPYLSIIYELGKTTFIPKSDGNPAIPPNAIMMPPWVQKTGSPNSGHSWSRGTMIGSKTYSNVWFNVNTGDYRFIIPRSYCDAAGFKITSDNISGNSESNATGTFRWDETTPTKLTLSNITVTARDDDADFARGGDARCLMGGPNFFGKYRIVVWDTSMAFIPLDSSTPPPLQEPADKGIEKTGYDRDVGRWMAVNMRDYPTKGKIIDRYLKNVRTDFQSLENAQLWLSWKRSTVGL